MRMASVAEPRYEAYRQALRGRTLPCAFVDLELWKANVEAVSRRAAGLPVRVASKSVRSVGMLRRILAADRMFRGVMCLTAREAAHLAGHGIDDLLVGYPVLADEELAAAAGVVAAGGRLVLTFDCAEHVDRLAAAASRHGVTFALCLDVDLSSQFPGLYFGVRRSPVKTPATALELARLVSRFPQLHLEAVLGYEAQIAGVPDAVAGQWARNTLMRLLKRLSRRQVARRRAAVVGALAGAGFALRFVNGGGTGSLESTRRDPSVSELTAGSGFYSPALFDGYRDFRHLPAAGFALPITRRPAPGLFTCLGGGYVASGAAGRDKLPVPYLPRGARLLANEGAGEVQTPVLYRGPQRIDLGDPVCFRHAKAGELCERFDRLLLIDDGEVVGEEITYRGEGECFL